MGTLDKISWIAKAEVNRSTSAQGGVYEAARMILRKHEIQAPMATKEFRAMVKRGSVGLALGLGALMMAVSGCSAGEQVSSPTPTVESPTAPATDAPPVESVTPADDVEVAVDPRPIVVDDLMVSLISDEQIEMVNGGPFKKWSDATKRTVAAPGEAEYETFMENPWKVTPSECKDALIFIDRWSLANWEAASPQGVAQDVIVKNQGVDDTQLYAWVSRAVLSTPEAASDLVNKAAADFPGCVGAKYFAGSGDVSELEGEVAPVAGAWVYRNEGNFSFVEPIGAVVFSVFVLPFEADAGFGARASEIYNSLANELADIQGLQRMDVDLSSTTRQG